MLYVGQWWVVSECYVSESRGMMMWLVIVWLVEWVLFVFGFVVSDDLAVADFD